MTEVAAPLLQPAPPRPDAAHRAHRGGGEVEGVGRAYSGSASPRLAGGFELGADLRCGSAVALGRARRAWRLTISGELPTNIEISFLRAMAGLIVGGGIGFAFGLMNGLSRLSEQLSDSTLQMVRNVPHLALIPLVIVWFGIDEGAKLFLVALGVFFPIYLNTLHGVRSVDPQLIEMARSYGMSRADLFRRVILPGALPSISSGFATRLESCG